MADVLAIEDLHKHFGSGPHAVRANAGVTMRVGAGEVVGLLGHNGAGKTTLVNQVVGLLRPTSGSIRLDGVDAVADPALARRLTNVQAQANVPITGLTPLTAIDLVGRRGAHRGPRPGGVGHDSRTEDLRWRCPSDGLRHVRRRPRAPGHPRRAHQ